MEQQSPLRFFSVSFVLSFYWHAYRPEEEPGTDQVKAYYLPGGLMRNQSGLPSGSCASWYPRSLGVVDCCVVAQPLTTGTETRSRRAKKVAEYFFFILVYPPFKGWSDR